MFDVVFWVGYGGFYNEDGWKEEENKGVGWEEWIKNKWFVCDLIFFIVVVFIKLVKIFCLFFI